MRIRGVLRKSTATHKGRLAHVRGQLGETKAPKAPRLPGKTRRP